MESIEHKGLTIRIEQDQDVESPREWSNLGTMVYWHSRYTLGDEDGRHVFGEPADFLQHAKEQGAIYLPLYLYDHSGLTMSTAPFSCPWDSGQVGFIYVTRAAVLKEYGVKRITVKLRKQVVDLLRCEVETYDQYLQGDVYYFLIEDKDGDVLDSCSGFYGYDYAVEQAKEAADYQAEEIRKAREHADMFTNHVSAA